MSIIKLINRGEREIVFEGGVFYPQQVGEFTEAGAERMLRLFKGEVFSAEEAVADFTKEATVTDVEPVSVSTKKAK
jgi:hypothetical protein